MNMTPRCTDRFPAAADIHQVSPYKQEAWKALVREFQALNDEWQAERIGSCRSPAQLWFFSDGRPKSADDICASTHDLTLHESGLNSTSLFEALSIYRGPREDSFSTELLRMLQILAPSVNRILAKSLNSLWRNLQLNRVRTLWCK